VKSEPNKPAIKEKHRNEPINSKNKKQREGLTSLKKERNGR
jgi:hypothetical protein